MWHILLKFMALKNMQYSVVTEGSVQYFVMYTVYDAPHALYCVVYNSALAHKIGILSFNMHFLSIKRRKPFLMNFK